MTREKHGHYDATRHLPDNTGQPQGSGSIVAWHGQIKEQFGDETGQALIEASRAQGGVAWLLKRLAETGHADLVEAYKQSRRADAAASRIRDHERIIKRCEEQLTSETTVSRRAYLSKEIQKAQRYLEKHAPSEDL